MSDKWLVGNMFLHDGVILEAGPGEWGMVDAIDRYEADQLEKTRKLLKTMEKARERTGKWILAGVEEVIPGVPYLEKQCSRCGYVHSLRIPDDYCPKCGSHNAGNYDPSIEEFLTAYYNRTRNEKGKIDESDIQTDR